MATQDGQDEEDHDIALLYAWRSGDRAAGDRLTRQYYERVRGFFRLRVPMVADDLTQRTFLACTESMERVRTTSFRAFLFGVARKMLLKHFEAESRKSHSFEEFEVGRPQSILSPSGVVTQRREHWLLLRALDRLPDEMQTVIALFYVEGLRAREIADVLDVPTSTVTTRLSRARETLRREVEGLRAPAEVRRSLLSDIETWARSLGATVGPLRPLR
ncbi:RNA polymerase sigma factor [Paraliomyxa miuraensis]|uniref:RNA polymerase sigma factor n=1 Tax=Paraliomyxa miuraensis TaxID=376150 RepID=UPI002250981F|nr:sigma-70 family RNA polymerase sigma factor [Paraliomyxa miuraensis]MCX4245113.1 sigma-70 family RNA polymerase sigma factor [Paraliomyxa miuraensis]